MTLPHPDRTRDAFVLEEPLEIWGRDPVPGELEEAKRQFAQATQAYAAQQYADAAREFIAAAQTLRVDRPHAYAAEFAQRRVTSYHNAAWAALMTGTPGLARDLLEAAAKTDPDCAAEINTFRDSLPLASS